MTSKLSNRETRALQHSLDELNSLEDMEYGVFYAFEEVQGVFDEIDLREAATEVERLRDARERVRFLLDNC